MRSGISANGQSDRGKEGGRSTISASGQRVSSSSLPLSPSPSLLTSLPPSILLLFFSFIASASVSLEKQERGRREPRTAEIKEGKKVS